MAEGGFTLLELMLAILLLTGGIAATTFVMARGMFATTDAESMEQGLALAQEKMESIRGTAFASIASEAKAAVSGSGSCRLAWRRSNRHSPSRASI